MNPGGRRAINIATTIKIIDSAHTIVHRKSIILKMVHNIQVWNLLSSPFVQLKSEDGIQEIEGGNKEKRM